MALPHFSVIKNIPKNGCLLGASEKGEVAARATSLARAATSLVSFLLVLGRAADSYYCITLYPSLCLFWSIKLSTRGGALVARSEPPSSFWPQHRWTDGWMIEWWGAFKKDTRRLRETRQRASASSMPLTFSPFHQSAGPIGAEEAPSVAPSWPLTPLHNTTAAGLTFHHQLVLFPRILFDLTFPPLFQIIILPCQKWIWNKNGKTAKLPRVE